jgi:hypothetical protein
MQTKRRTKKHHFLAQGYLRNFSHREQRKQIWQITKSGDYRESLIRIIDAGSTRARAFAIASQSSSNWQSWRTSTPACSHESAGVNHYPMAAMSGYANSLR